MKTNTLSYLYDPLCGWCYAAAPLIKAVQDIEHLNIEMHAGGLWMGDNVKPITSELRAFVMPNDEYIHQVSGQPFGEAYFNVLLNDASAQLNSEPPIRAILAAEKMSQQGLAMLQRIQTTHYINGLKVSELTTLMSLAQALNLNTEDFEEAYQNTDLQTHIGKTHALMSQHQAQGFPTMLLTLDNGEIKRLKHGAFYGRPEDFKSSVQNAL